MLHGLSLFSGIGGIDLALNPWVRTVAYCEIDPYCVSVLRKRMGAGLDPGIVFDDVRALRRGHLSEPIDIVFGGFPCQDISLAGRREGLDGERSGLYREVVRLVAECEPTFVFLENVAAIRGHAWRVVEDLARLGFDCRWTSLSAVEVGAPHKRDRWWLLAAHPERLKLWVEPGRSSGQDGEGTPQPDLVSQTTWRETQPEFCGMDDGVPARVERLRSLGNAVVPAQAREAFKRLMGL